MNLPGGWEGGDRAARNIVIIIMELRFDENETGQRDKELLLSGISLFGYFLSEHAFLSKTLAHSIIMDCCSERKGNGAAPVVHSNWQN